MLSFSSNRSGDMETEFTKHRSRAEDITLRDENTNSGMFTLLDDFHSMDNNEFGEMLRDIEVPRKSTSFQENSEVSDLSHIQPPDDATSKNNLMEINQQEGHSLLENQRNDFGGFGLEDFGRGGLQEDLLNVPELPQLDLDISAVNRPQDEQEQQKDETMEVDKPLFPLPNDTLQEDEGFILEPVDVTTAGVKVRQKRKRKLVIDENKEMESDAIKSQLKDTSNTLRAKIYPPPSKKALIWKEICMLDHLYNNPCMPNVNGKLSSLVTRNLHFLSKEDMNIDTSLLQEIELPREDPADIPLGGSMVDETMVPVVNDVPMNDTIVAQQDDAHQLDMLDDIREDNNITLSMDGNQPGPLEEEGTVKIIPELPDLEGEIENEMNKEETYPSTGEGDTANDKEERRWNKRTQQVLKMLDKCFTQASGDIRFKDISRKCNRKQAASRFYSCLLLAKEGAIQFKQKEPYSEIIIEQGPGYTKVA